MSSAVQRQAALTAGGGARSGERRRSRFHSLACIDHGDGALICHLTLRYVSLRFDRYRQNG